MKLLNGLVLGMLVPLTETCAFAVSLQSETGYADFGSHCALQIKFAEGGRIVAKNGRGGMVINIPKKYDQYSRDRGFMLSCESDVVEAMSGSPARLDVKAGAWVRDSDGYIRSLNSGFTDQEFKDTEKAIRFYSLKAVNANGFLFTIDDTIGEESRRGRYIRFCLAKTDVALCGSGNAPVMLLADGDKADPTLFLKRVIESIEFLDVNK